MAKSVGKVFEENFKKSIPENVFCYRPPDAAQSFNMQSNLRFSSKSPCDYFIFNGATLFCFELKTVSGKSISFERTKEEKGVIHYYQIESLNKMSKYSSIVCGFVFDFRVTDNTYFIEINKFNELINSVNKKSIDEKDLLLYHPVLIDKKKLKVNYKYNVEKLLFDIEEEMENGRN